MKRLIASALAAGMLMLPLTGTAVAKFEMPAPDDPGCVGKAIAARNHASGVNPDANDSKGPGYYHARDILLADTVKEALAIARAYCD